MKKQLLYACAVLINCAWLAGSLSAQWTSNGPYGGAVYAVEVVGNTAFAGTGGNGVFKSTDDGQTWTAANTGMKGKWIMAMAAQGNKIYAGTEYDGMYVSSDNGDSWTMKNNGLTDIHVSSVFAATNGIYIGTSGGAYFSNNGGNIWTNVSNGLPATYNVYAWAQMGDTLYAATYGAGLFMSDDAGAQWTQVSSGLPVGPTGAYFYSLYTQGDNIFAGTNMGIYKSSDRGVTWNLSNTGMPSGVYAVSFTSKPGYLFAGTHSAGVFISTDGGASWTVSNSGMQQWTGNNMGPNFAYARVNELGVSGSAVLAATFDRMYRSTNNGSTWTNANNGILATRIMDIAASGMHAYAGEQGTGMYMTADQGASWSRDNSGLPTGYVLAVATRGSVVFAAVENHKVFRSTDNGATWVSASNGLSYVVDLLAADDTRVLAVTRGGQYFNQKLYITSDDGANWTEIVGANAISGGFSAIAIHGNAIYVGTYNGGLYKSTNDGASWTDIGSYLPTAKITAILPTNDATYVGTDSKGIFKFINNDQTMITASAGLTNTNITDIVMENDMLFASTWGSGIFASNTQGALWFNTSENIDNKFIVALAAADGKVYAGTLAGVYQTDDDAFARFLVMSGVVKNDRHDALTVYPNPATSSVHFSASDVKSVRLFNITGRLIQTAATGGTLDVSTLPRGVYVVQLETSNGSVTRKIVLE